MHSDAESRLPRGKVKAALAVLVALIFSKYVYMASLTSYYTFYLIQKFHLSVHSAQVHLFVFLGAVAAGTFMGGPIGDRIGRKYVIWCSILGVLPFTLMLPYANLFWTGVLTVIYRAGAGVGVLGDSGLCAGTGARTGGYDQRDLLRPGLRDRRSRGGAAGTGGGRAGNRVRVPAVRVPAGYRALDGALARCGAGALVAGD